MLGEGAFGLVYKGVNTVNNEVVAIKCINKAKTKSIKEFPELIKAEKMIMQQLNSPYIVKFYSMFETLNNWYIISEFCGEGDLRKMLDEYKQFTEPEAIAIL